MSTVNELEIQQQLNDIAQYKEAIALQDKLKLLQENELFKELVLELFCVKECADYLKFSVSNTTHTDATRNAENMAKAAGYFEQWMDKIHTLGNQSRNKIERAHENLDRLRAEVIQEGEE